MIEILEQNALALEVVSMWACINSLSHCLGAGHVL